MQQPRSLLLTASIVAAGLPAFAAPRSDEAILKSVKLPDGYEATVFAKPPEVSYPAACAATADGTLFVAVDENGSLDAKEKRGRVVRARDTNGDGKADEFKVFAEMDSPRGLVWDGPSGNGPGTLYVVHPPMVTAYTDTDGDGKSDKQEDIVTGLGFDLKFRGADHTTNGCRLGIDGFIYIAVGDYGFVEAKAKDGTVIKNRGGGIVRVRPDGTGLEIVSRGQRNIYDVAVSPTLELFTRDNTNDGGGWNVRLSHVPAGAQMGYPYLFKNFSEDMVPALADYGGGSPCGSLWLDEPGLQNGLYTVEWGSSAIMYHTLEPKGAGFALTGPNQGQNAWMKLQRPTDMDVDGAGNLFVTSWEGASYTYAGPDAGYVLRVVKKDKPKTEVPDIAKATVQQLVDLLRGPSGALRIAANRELVARASRPGWQPKANVAIKASNDDEFAAEVFAVVATANELTNHLKKPVQWNITGTQAKPDVVTLAGLRFGSDPKLAVRSLTSPDAKIRAAAITALRRLGKKDEAKAILPLVADADPVVSHLAVRALGELKAFEACLAALDSADDKVKAGALRALYAIYDPAVVDGLLSRLPNAKGETRRGILNTLCRLANQDAPYETPKVWWGTRPDTSGPVYQPIRWAATDKIEAGLKKALDASSDDESRWLVQRLYATKVNFPGLIELMLAKAGNDTDAKLTAINGLFRPDNSVASEGLNALLAIATNEKETPDFRAKALRLLQRAAEKGETLDAVLGAFAVLVAHDPGQAALTSAFEDFTHDGKNGKHIGALQKVAQGSDAAKRTLAQTILLNLATSNLVKGKEKENAEKAVAEAWEKPETAASLLGVIARTKAKGMAEQVQAHLKDPNNTVAEAALYAYQALGLKDTGAPSKPIGQMTYEEVFAAVQKGGDAAQGKDMFLRSGCIACHTVSSDEPPKGPILSAVAKIYDRAALTESILKPNAKLAQGFESTWIKTKKGEQIEGFVTREGGDSVDVRNIAGQTVMVEKGEITERGHRPQSMMPEGLLNAFTPAELANLLAYIESLKTAK